MKKIFFASLLLLLAIKVNAQITGNDYSGIAPTNYTDGSPQDFIYIWCGDDLNATQGSLTANPPSPGTYTITWYYHNAAGSNWAFYSSETGSSSTISNLPSDGYRVQVHDASNNIVGCYTAWVWNMNVEMDAEVTQTSCDSVALNGSLEGNTTYTYFNPPHSEAYITQDTQIIVCFSAVHTYVSDLAFYLVGPGGSPTILLSPNPGANGQGPVCNSNNNVNALCFSTSSTANFNPCIPETDCGTTTNCLSNYSGVYGTYGPGSTPINWSPLYGINAAQGGWAVKIYDCIGIDVGTLTNASIIFTNLDANCGASTTLSYNSGNISSTINDNSCTPQTASIFEVPLVTPPPPITINATIAPLWLSSPMVSIDNPVELSTTASNLPAGTIEFTLTTNVMYGSAICTYTASDTIVIDEIAIPVFDEIGTICTEEPSPLQNTSINGISGTWSPAFDSTQTATYTFTPNDDECAEEVTLTITVTDEITPEFFPIAPICAGQALTPLPTTSNNGITGSWFPLAMNNQQTTTYTFTPDDGQCAVPVTMTITVNPQTVPSFSQQGPYCAGQTFSLPSISNNGADSVTGFWSLAINNQQTTTYIFTPISGGCNPTSTSMTIVINPLVTPEFELPDSICAGSAAPTLPPMWDNFLSGSWSPSAVDVTQTTTYEFTPTAGQCGLPYTHTIEVVQPTIPTFDLVTDFCYGDTPAALPTLSDNNVQGSWLPSAIDTTITGNTVYTFTPLAGECAEEITVTVNVNEPFVPLFSAVPGICQGEVLAPLPTTSNNGITGSWSPAIDNTQTTTYEFTPDAGQCAVSTTLTIDVEPLVTPLFDAYPVFCSGENIPPLPTTSNNGITGSWSPAIDNTQTTTYTFTPDDGQCSLGTTMTITVNSWVTPNFEENYTVCVGSSTPLLPVSPNGVTGVWNPAFDDTQSGTYRSEEH